MLVLLHVPHTSMYPVYNIMSNLSIHHFYVKTENDFHNMKKRTLNVDDVQYYFILRNPIERISKEFIHSKQEIKISDHIMIERNRNVNCKYILGSSEPITDESFNEVLHLISQGKVKYDLFSEKTEYDTLFKLTGINMYDYGVTNEYKNKKRIPFFVPQELLFKFNEFNEYDIKLYNKLTNMT